MCGACALSPAVVVGIERQEFPAGSEALFFFSYFARRQPRRGRRWRHGSPLSARKCFGWLRATTLIGQAGGARDESQWDRPWSTFLSSGRVEKRNRYPVQLLVPFLSPTIARQGPEDGGS